MIQKNKAVILISLLALAGCAHQPAVDRKVEQELKAEPAVAPGGPLAAESHRLIMEAPGLAQSQKEKLLALHTRMAGEMKTMREEEGKLKMVFFKTLLNPKAERAELINLRSRIFKLDQKKTNRMLSALEEASKILGRESIDDDHFYRAFLMEDRTGR